MLIKSIISVFLISITLHCQGQNNYPKDYFGAPIDYAVRLSGTFGELRGDHFHSGIDIKTYGGVGKNIYAIADGYVSRVKVSPYGFGKAVYINHPNGYTSVYAHLLSFSSEIDNYVKRNQYKRKSYAVNLFPPRNSLMVKKGDLIAVSGNSGGSGGPHLHFEIRKSATQIPLNPLHFGYKVKDYITPTMKFLRIYPLGEFSMVDSACRAKTFKLTGWGKKYRADDYDTISVSGDIAFGISVHDKLNDAPNKNGVYSISVFVDDKKLYEHKMDKFSFGESSYIKSLIDYTEYVSSGEKFQRTLIDPGNKLPVYGEVLNQGIYQFIDDNDHKLKYVVRDFAGNVSELNVVLKSIPYSDSMITVSNQGSAYYFNWQTPNTFKNNGFSLEAPANAFYKSFYFTFSHKVSDSTLCADIYKVHKRSTPVHKSMKIRIEVDSSCYELRDKLCLVKINDDEKYYSGGKYEDGFLISSISSFGTYSVSYDTTAPEVSFDNIARHDTLQKGTTIKIRIDDDFSGIRTYVPELNGNWVIMEYDPKTQGLYYQPERYLKKGKNTLIVTVYDRKNNLTVRKLNFFY